MIAPWRERTPAPINKGLLPGFLIFSAFLRYALSPRPFLSLNLAFVFRSLGMSTSSKLTREQKGKMAATTTSPERDPEAVRRSDESPEAVHREAMMDTTRSMTL